MNRFRRQARQTRPDRSQKWTLKVAGTAISETETGTVSFRGTVTLADVTTCGGVAVSGERISIARTALGADQLDLTQFTLIGDGVTISDSTFTGDALVQADTTIADTIVDSTECVEFPAGTRIHDGHIRSPKDLAVLQFGAVGDNERSVTIYRKKPDPLQEARHSTFEGGLFAQFTIGDAGAGVIVADLRTLCSTGDITFSVPIADSGTSDEDRTGFSVTDLNAVLHHASMMNPDG